MRRLTALWLVSIVIVGGCAQAMPGYIPPTPKIDKIKALAPKGGGFDGAGEYSLTEQEQKLDCKHLTGGVTIKIIQLREAASRPKPSATASAAQQAIKPFKGATTYAVDTSEDYKRDLARLHTLNKQLAAKNCRTFDLEADLKPGNTAVPVPVGEAKAGGEKKNK